MALPGWLRRARQSAAQLGERLVTLEVDLVLSDGIEARPAPTYREATRRIAELAHAELAPGGALRSAGPTATGSDRELAELLARLRTAPEPTLRLERHEPGTPGATRSGLVAALEVLAPAEERARVGLDTLPVEPVPVVRLATAQKVAATAGRPVIARTTITLLGDVVTEVDRGHIDDLAHYLPLHGLGVEASTASWKNLVDAVVALVGTLRWTRVDR